MESEWDEAKNSSCFERHGSDFVYTVRNSARKASGEEIADYEHNVHQD